MLTLGVLGANGFVGSRIVEKLHLEGTARVVPIVRSFSSLARTSRFALEARIADALDGPALAKAFAGCDAVVSAVLGSYNQIVAEPPIIYGAAEAAGVRRLIHISTASVHGQNPEPGTDETSKLRTDHAFPYNNAKVRAELQYQALRQRGRVELVMLRPGIVFGPRDVWITGIARALTRGEAYLVDGGQGYCNTVYIDNLVHAIALSLTEAVDRETFLIGDNEPITWAELYRAVAAALGDCPAPRILHNPRIDYPSRPPIERLREAKGLKAVLRHVPKPMKALARRQLRLLEGAREGIREMQREQRRTDWMLPEEQAADAVPVDVADLHRCRYKVPFARARARLRYEPPVSVGDGLVRTIRTLRFAGFSVDPAFAWTVRTPTPARDEPSAAVNEASTTVPAA